MAKITRTVITHMITLSKVVGKEIVEIEKREVVKLPQTRELAKLSKEHKATVVITEDIPIEHKYAMDVEKFIENAELVEVTDGASEE